MTYRIPILPVYEMPGSRPVQGDWQITDSFLDAGEPVFLQSGSAAIELALRSARIGSTDQVLVPAYHCPTMVEPIHRTGAGVIYFEINKDTSVNLASVREKLTDKCKAILVPHFFAIRQDLSDIRKLCDRKNLVLIEDCAHAFFGARDGVPFGASGDYSIASTRKFFAGSEGGCLIANTGDSLTSIVGKPSFVEELKSALDVLETSSDFGKLGWLNFLVVQLLSAKRGVVKIVRLLLGPPDIAEVSEPTTNVMTEPLIRTITKVSRRLVEKANLQAICEIRRRNYELLDERLADIPGFHRLVREFPDDATPYMYPLLVDNAEIYLAMREGGWAVWRWDDSDSSCAVSHYFSRHLLQLPCHQSLGTETIERMSTEIIRLNEVLL
jgi:perosamine synthetase